MESRSYVVTVEKDCPQPETLPALLELVSSNQVVDFASIEEDDTFPPTPSAEGTESFEFQNLTNVPRPNNHLMHAVSISMPTSPILSSSNKGNVTFADGVQEPTSASGPLPEQVKFHSQPMPKGDVLDPAIIGSIPNHPSIRLKDRRFDTFKTWSGKLERQISNLRGKPHEQGPEEKPPRSSENNDALPVDRYFDALQGPELDTLRPSEELVLPDDKKWPFLLRFPISSFGICLGVSSQAIMWKALATASSTKFLHISLDVNMILWCISVALVAVVSSTYLLKVIFFFEAVRREYYHPIRVNFFFAPWISLLFLCLGVPPSVTENLPVALWYVLMAPFFILELKIYGQWMSGGQRRLSKVANPSNHLSIVGNFVGALLGASMGLKEGPIFFFAVGLAHYTVLFVTLYQRLPTNETLPKELHPVFFLFVAAPSVASMAWAKIEGSFTHGARIAYFIALFLYFSLAVRVNFFRGFKFSLAWWAYTFPMTGAAIATIRYSSEVTNLVNQSLSVILSVVSTLTVTALLVSTILHAFVVRDLFPNDIAIAISYRKPRQHKKWFHRRNGSSEHARDIENFLKFATKDGDDEDSCKKTATLDGH